MSLSPTLERETTLAISPAGFRRVADYITSHLGIRMSPAKIPLLQSRLQRRLRIAGCDSLEQYLERVVASPEGEGEVLEFIDAVTTNKTDFFREPQHFDFLARVALPQLDPGAGLSWQPSIWSAGCSSGQEVYTLAMVLSEYGAARGGFDFRILGTDISCRMLQAAETAIYEAALVDPVPPDLRRKYLLRSRDELHPRVRVGPEVRSKTRFRRLNLMSTTYEVGEEFDVIFFRNVMIYFDKTTQQNVVSRLCERLRPGGYLFVGHSESLTGLALPLRPVAAAVYRRV